MSLLINEQQKSYQNAKTCYIGKKPFKDIYAEDTKYCKIRDHCHYSGEYSSNVHSVSHLNYNLSKRFSIFFHNGYNYDSMIIILS